MPATIHQLCLYDRMHRRKFPLILMSGAESEELVWVRELVKYHVKLEHMRTYPMF